MTAWQTYLRTLRMLLPERWQAVLLVVASRVWLTILEILPAVLFLAHRWVRRQRPHGSTEITQ